MALDSSGRFQTAFSRTIVKAGVNSRYSLQQHMSNSQADALISHAPSFTRSVCAIWNLSLLKGPCQLSWPQ